MGIPFGRAMYSHVHNSQLSVPFGSCYIITLGDVNLP